MAHTFDVVKYNCFMVNTMASTYFDFLNRPRIAGIWTWDLPISKPMLYHWANSPLCCTFPKSTVIQLNLPCILLVILSRLTLCYLDQNTPKFMHLLEKIALCVPPPKLQFFGHNFVFKKNYLLGCSFSTSPSWGLFYKFTSL